MDFYNVRDCLTKACCCPDVCVVDLHMCAYKHVLSITMYIRASIYTHLHRHLYECIDT